jgi:hypothetical protein
MSTFSHDVLKLSKVDYRPFQVRLGGMVVVMIHDSGSRPPTDIHVEAGRAFEKMGIVAGNQNDDGEVLFGGGFTWYVLKPVTAGVAEVDVKFTENGSNAKIHRHYKVEILP